MYFFRQPAAHGRANFWRGIKRTYSFKSVFSIRHYLHALIVREKFYRGVFVWAEVLCEQWKKVRFLQEQAMAIFLSRSFVGVSTEWGGSTGKRCTKSKHVAFVWHDEEILVRKSLKRFLFGFCGEFPWITGILECIQLKFQWGLVTSCVDFSRAFGLFIIPPI